MGKDELTGVLQERFDLLEADVDEATRIANGAVNSEFSQVAFDAPAVTEVEGAVELFIDDKDPRGEAFLEFMMEQKPAANAIGESDVIMWVINNEDQFSNREDNPTPDDFDRAYTTLPREVASITAYIERFLSAYDSGQDDLDALLSTNITGNDLTESTQAMAVIVEGDDWPDIQDYRT